MMKTIRPILLLLVMLSVCVHAQIAQGKNLWQIGKADNSSAEFALAPNEYDQFQAEDFGFEDDFYLIGRSTEKEDWPYVLPGTADEWAGSWKWTGCFSIS